MTEKKTFFLRFELCSSSNSTAVTTEIPFESVPKSFHKISDEIEALFSIPVCVQSLRLCYPDYCHKIKDSDTPASLYVRSGDLLMVHYPLQGECREVRYAKNNLFIIVETVTKLLKMADNQHECCIGMKFVTKYMLWNTIRADKLAICLSPLYPWTDLAHVNKLFFASLGGVDLLLRLYELVLKFRKKQISLQEGEMLEVVCVHTLSSFTGSMDFSHSVANQECMELLLDTFLWVPINSEQATDVHIAAIQVALHAICNILVPDHYAELDRSCEVIVQSIAICMTPVYNCKTAIVSIMLLTCMSYCCELSAAMLPKFFTDVLTILDFRREIHPNETAAIAVLEAYASTLFALQIVNDVRAFQDYEESLLQQIIELLEKVCDSDPSIVRAYEINAEFFWGSSLPSLTSLYRPDDVESQVATPIMEKLLKLCIQTLLHVLRIILGCHTNLIILLNEDLFDYALCLPWIVPSHSHAKALEVVQEVCKLTQVQPSSLQSLAKAKLAKMEYGLRRVLLAVSISDLLYS